MSRPLPKARTRTATVTEPGCACLPGGVLLKAGKFYAEFGRRNRLHAHAFPFLDAPLVHQRLLGGEGLDEAGLSLSWLTPLPWFVEITGQVLDGTNQRFASEHGEDLLYLGHAKSFWDLGDETTIELGGSAAAGANAGGGTSSILGSDFTMKWRPLGAGTRRALVWQTEYLRAADSAPGGKTRGRPLHGGHAPTPPSPRTSPDQ